jgi:hypothetical protein
MFYVFYSELLFLISFSFVLSILFVSPAWLCPCFSSAPHFLTNAEVRLYLLNVISECRKLFYVYLPKTPDRITDSEIQQSSAFVQEIRSK